MTPEQQLAFDKAKDAASKLKRGELITEVAHLTQEQLEYEFEKLALEADNKRLREALKKRLTTIEKFRQHMQSMCTVCKQNAENVKNGIIGAVYCGRHNQSTEEMMIREALSAPQPPVSGILRLAKAADEYMQAKNMMYGADCDAGLAEVSYIVCRKHAQLQLAHEALTPEERAILEGVEL